MQIQPWNLVFLIGFVIYMTTRGYYIRQMKKHGRAQPVLTSQERVLLLLMAIGTLFLPLIYLFTPWLSFADYDLPAWMPWCGLVAMIGGLLLFWRSHADLGINWSVTVELRTGHQLITHGVYHRVRHPMYAAIWLFSIAQGLLLANWLAGWAAVVAFVPMYIIRLPREERMMVEQFGEAYVEYAKRTGRVLPRFGG